MAIRGKAVRSAARLLLFLLFFHAACALPIEQVFPRFYADRSVQSVREFLGFGPGQGFRTVTATRPDHPEGWYFVVKLDRKWPPQVATARLTVFRNDSLEEAVHEWDLRNLPPRRILYLGITGNDWPEGDSVRPLAWNLQIRDGDGRLLADWQSFLWSQP